MGTNPTDGPSIYWYEDDSPAFRVLAVASALRCALAAPPVFVPPHVRDAAQAVHRTLSQNPNADIRHYVTHEHGPDNLLVLKRRLGE
jgi:hypothetical protein